ncbi:MAG: NAD(P)-dependent oxidoreductase [Legionellaceae bacterium]|nr:NAD(P)-dependent oxidoreductase [Legionellaceae bacterium]
MKILITGTNGFVGKNLLEYYQSRYEHVYSPKRADLDLLDSQAVENYLAKHRFDVVINNAVTLTSVEQNIKIYFNLERCSDLFGFMINPGSGSEYDPKHYEPKMKESYFGKYIPDDIYGFSKYVIAKDIEYKSGNIVNLRLFGVFGKYENYKRRFISDNISRALSGMDLSVNKNVYFDYLYIDDFCKITEMVIKKRPKKHTYNICTGERIDLFSLARTIRDVHGHEVLIQVKQEGLNPEYSGDNSLFISEYGNFNFTELKKSIALLYQWYRDESNLVFDKKEYC